MTRDTKTKDVIKSSMYSRGNIFTRRSKQRQEEIKSDLTKSIHFFDVKIYDCFVEEIRSVSGFQFIFLVEGLEDNIEKAQKSIAM